MTDAQKQRLKLEILSEAETMLRELLAQNEAVNLHAIKPEILKNMIEGLGDDHDVAAGKKMLSTILENEGRTGLQGFMDHCLGVLQKQGTLGMNDLREPERHVLHKIPGKLITGKLAAGVLGTGVVGVTLGSIGLAKKISGSWADQVKPKAETTDIKAKDAPAAPQQSGITHTLQECKEWLEPLMSLGVGIAALALARREYHGVKMEQVAKAVSRLKHHVQDEHRNLGRISTL